MATSKSSTAGGSSKTTTNQASTNANLDNVLKEHQQILNALHGASPEWVIPNAIIKRCSNSYALSAKGA